MSMTNSYDNLISAELSEKDVAEIQTCIATLKKKLNFLIQLSAEDKRRLAKPGADALLACESIAHVIANNTKLIPKEAIDPEEMHRDLALIRALVPLHDTFQGFVDTINDTLLAAKSDVYRNALRGYTLAQALGRSVPGVEAALAPLKETLDRPTRIKKKV